ncbi:MAG: heavy metal-associated domain-containing protein [Candidatus Sericytochromatia bacterium]
MEKIIINIDGMHCSSCATKVENALKEVTNVNKVIVSIENKNAEIEYLSNPPSQKDIRRAIDKVGFSLS